METGIPMDSSGMIPVATPEELYDYGVKFVAKYGPNYLQKPVFAGFMTGGEFGEAIYVESRKLFDSMR